MFTIRKAINSFLKCHFAYNRLIYRFINVIVIWLLIPLYLHNFILQNNVLKESYYNIEWSFANRLNQTQYFCLPRVSFINLMMLPQECLCQGAIFLILLPTKLQTFFCNINPRQHKETQMYSKEICRTFIYIESTKQFLISL